MEQGVNPCEVERLWQDFIRLSRLRRPHPCRRHQDARWWGQPIVCRHCPKRRNELGAIHLRHHIVGEHQRGPCLIHQFKRAPPLQGDLWGIPFVGHHIGERLGDWLLVIKNEDEKRVICRGTVLYMRCAHSSSPLLLLFLPNGVREFLYHTFHTIS